VATLKIKRTMTTKSLWFGEYFPKIPECIIFKEYRKTSGMFWGVAVTTKSRSFLEVLESQHYTLEQTKWDESDQESVNQLQRLAVKDKIKFVKIPARYSDEQLDKARKMCFDPPVVPTTQPQNLEFSNAEGDGF
jgi:hypothetical protein